MKAAPRARKKPVSIRLDAEVLAWFKRQGPGYQTRINALLRFYMNAGSGAQADNFVSGRRRA